MNELYICEQCHKPFPSGSAEVCPYCGVVQEHGGIKLHKIPETIKEFQAFCAYHHMPLDKMRFFIGEDYQEPCAFGIYKNAEGNFVVYKNKDTGERSVRYEGPDEAFACKTLYDKMKSEVDKRTGREDIAPNITGTRTTTTVTKNERIEKTIEFREESERSAKAKDTTIRASIMVGLIALICLIAATMFGVASSIRQNPHDGYYRYNNTLYYNIDNDWYFYRQSTGEYGAWLRSSDTPSGLTENPSQYYDRAQTYFGDSDFTDTFYYDEYANRNSGSLSTNSQSNSWASEYSGSTYDDYDWDNANWDLWSSYDNDSSWSSDWSSDYSSSYDDYSWDNWGDSSSWDYSDSDWGSDW